MMVMKARVAGVAEAALDEKFGLGKNFKPYLVKTR